MNHWPTLAHLPLTIDALEYGQLDPGEGFGEAHATRLVRLSGGGREGLSEDITLFAGGEAPQLDLVGTWTLGALCERLDELDQWPGGFPKDMQDAPPAMREMVGRWRNWAYEAAALDLALAQAGRALHEVLGLEPRPIAYVNSFGRLDDDIAGNAARRFERYPDIRFKLDVDEKWSDEVVAKLAATGAVDVVDFKGRYGMPVEDEAALVALYERVLAAFPDALIEDPHDRPAITDLVAPHAARVAYDAPIHTVADLDAQPIAAQTFNIKPCRVGRLSDLFELYDECERRGAGLYGGGMGELGVGRGQVQLLASLFSPGGTNDVAPPGFNALVPEPGLPLSPLDPRPARAGFHIRRTD
jgi:hypothetical protein